MSDLETVQAEVIKELGLFGLKTLLTLNAGACLAILVFLGNVLAAENTAAKVEASAIRCSMLWFIIGIALALFAVTATYILAQLQMSGNARALKLSSFAFLAIMILPAICSFIAFSIGAWTASGAIIW